MVKILALVVLLIIARVVIQSYERVPNIFGLFTSVILLLLSVLLLQTGLSWVVESLARDYDTQTEKCTGYKVEEGSCFGVTELKTQEDLDKEWEEYLKESEEIKKNENSNKSEQTEQNNQNNNNEEEINGQEQEDGESNPESTEEGT